jgi:tetratricopeptide (TPR) repeat protein
MGPFSVCMFVVISSLLPHSGHQQGVRTFEASAKQSVEVVSDLKKAPIAAFTRAKVEVLEKAAHYLGGVTPVRDRQLNGDLLAALTRSLVEVNPVSQEETPEGKPLEVLVRARGTLELREIEQKVEELLKDSVLMEQLVLLKEREEALLNEMRRWTPGGSRERMKETASALEAVAGCERALFLLRGGKGPHGRQEALHSADESLKSDPEFGLAYYIRGRIHADSRNYGAALSDFGQAIEKGLATHWVYTNRGRTYCEWKDYDAGLLDLGEAIRLAPDSATAFYNRGIAHFEMREYESAKEDFSKAIDQDPTYADAYNNRAAVNLGMGDYANVIEDANQAIALNPKIPMAYYNRGTAYTHQQNYGMAIRDYTKAIELDQGFAPAYNNRGLVLILSGSLKAGCADVERACHLGLCDGRESTLGNGSCF